MRCGLVIYECTITSVGKHERRTVVLGELLQCESLVRYPIGSVSAVRCLVDGLVRAIIHVSMSMSARQRVCYRFIVL